MIGFPNGIWWNNDIGRRRKRNIYKSIIKSTLLYGTETWTIAEKNRKKLEATEMDVFRRTLGISRMERIRNEEVRLRMGIEDTIMKDVKHKQLIWYGHVNRISETRVPKIIMKWVPTFRRKRGRPQKTWKEGVAKAMSVRDLGERQIYI